MKQEKLYWLIKFRTTQYYFYFSLLQLVLTVVLLSCVTLQYEQMVFELQVAIAFFLLVDMQLLSESRTIRYLTDRENFFRKVINDVDIGIEFLICSFLAIEIFTNFDVSFFLGQVESIVIDARYGLQIYRIYALLKQAKENRQVNNYQDLRLDNSVQVDLNDDIMHDIIISKSQPKGL